jgi:DNA-binding NtrC family response regulator
MLTKRVLVVDDESSITTSLTSVLQSEEVEVMTAATATEAEALLRTHRPFGLVITDLSLAGTGSREGLDLISQVKKLDPGAHAIMLTAHGSTQIRSEALQRGATDYWEKSIPIAEIVRRIRALGLPVGPRSAREEE